MEAYYFALEGKEFYIILDAPDNVQTTAGSLIANTSGTVKINTTVLVSPEDVDQAVKQTMDWSPPGE